METSKKFRLLENDTICVNGKILHRIEALRDFAGVMKGNKGGYVEKEENLSHSGICWIFNNTRVMNNAKVTDNARIYGDTLINNNALIADNAQVLDSFISDNVCVCGNELVISATLLD